MKTTALLFLAFIVSLHAEDLLIADFEGDDYGDWHVEGTAFGDKPARGTLPGQMHVSEYQGHGLVNSYHGGDGSVGKLTSPVFTLNHSYIRFLIGGGGWDDTRMDLLAEMEPNVFTVVRTACGPNIKPGGSEALRPDFWDVHELKGKRIRFEIIDGHRGGWGHINVDHIVATDEKPSLPRYNVAFELVVTKPWLLLPVSNTERDTKLTIRDGDALLHSLSVKLTDKPAWRPAMDVSAHVGKTLKFVIDRIPPDSQLTESFVFADNPPEDDNPYGESLRPLIHFTPYRGWNNDPNGLVFYNGEYHMFFQHNPYGVNWGNMHWGHAVSKDLFHWTELPDALSPDPLGPMFSGSAVVDTNNTSGFGKDGIAPLVLIYTAAGNPAVQCIAYSLDGRTFTKYSGNPVLPNQTSGNRDPKVIWHEPTQSWIMALYVLRPNNTHTVEIWGSKNLKEWTKRSVIQGGTNGSRFLYECPEIFELQLEGTNETRWIVYGGNGEYVVGKFDGVTFTPETPPLPGHRGCNLYASQTFNNEPHGRRIQIYWMQAATPSDVNFNQGMTIPQELKLVKTPQGPRLAHVPLIPPVNDGPLVLHIPFDASSIKMPDAVAFRCDITASNLSNDAVIGGVFRGIDIRYDASTQKLTIGKAVLNWPTDNNRFHLILFMDTTAIECFSGDGLNYGVVACRPAINNVQSTVNVFKGTAADKSAHFTKFRSIFSREP